MNCRAVLEVHLGGRVRLRRAHPCGSREWVVDRVGADIGLSCEGCGRRVLISRAQLERRVAELIPVHAPPGEPAAASAPRGARA